MKVYDTFGMLIHSPSSSTNLIYSASYNVILDTLPQDTNLCAAFVHQGVILSSPPQTTISFATRSFIA